MTASYIIKSLVVIMIFMMLSIIIASTLVSFIHPLVHILMLVIYTMTTLMMLFMMTKVSMYMYMIFISIIGGMMIMFLYFTSMINNYPSKIKLSEFIMIIYLVVAFIMMGTLVAMIIPNMEEFQMDNKFTLNKSFIFKIYIYPLNIITTATILNLLYCLIATFKMCSSKYSPLRKINYEKF